MENIFRGHSCFILLLVGGDIIAAAAYSKPPNEHVYREADSLPSPTSPSQTHPQRRPGWPIYGHVLGMSWEGNGLVHQSRVFSPFKNHCFQILLCSGENHKRLFWCWPDCYLPHQLPLKELFSLWGMILRCLKPMKNQVGWSQFCTLPVLPDWEPVIQCEASKPSLPRLLLRQWSVI